MGMFDNYTTDSSRGNRHDFILLDELDDIVRGGTTVHVFTVACTTTVFYEKVSKFQIFYRQSLTDMVLIDSTAVGSPVIVQASSDGTKTNIIVTLSPATTLNFSTLRETFAQMKLYMTDGSVVFGDINKVKVVDTLDQDPTVDTFVEASASELIDIDDANADDLVQLI